VGETHVIIDCSSYFMQFNGKCIGCSSSSNEGEVSHYEFEVEDVGVYSSPPVNCCCMQRLN